MANSFIDSVTIPAFQSAITGTLTGLTVAGAAALLECPVSLELGLTAGAGAALVSWLDYRARWQQVLERLLQVDINGDGRIGEGEPAAEHTRAELVRVEVIEDQGRAGQFIDLPAKPEQLTALADGIAAGRAFAQTAWTGNGAPFTRSEFEALRAEMLRRGLARWRKEGAPGQGAELTLPGRAVLRHFASDTGAHSPTLKEQKTQA